MEGEGRMSFGRYLIDKYTFLIGMFLVGLFFAIVTLPSYLVYLRYGEWWGGLVLIVSWACFYLIGDYMDYQRESK